MVLCVCHCLLHAVGICAWLKALGHTSQRRPYLWFHQSPQRHTGALQQQQQHASYALSPSEALWTIGPTHWTPDPKPSREYFRSILWTHNRATQFAGPQTCWEFGHLHYHPLHRSCPDRESLLKASGYASLRKCSGRTAPTLAMFFSLLTSEFHATNFTPADLSNKPRLQLTGSGIGSPCQHNWQFFPFARFFSILAGHIKVG